MRGAVRLLHAQKLEDLQRFFTHWLSSLEEECFRLSYIPHTTFHHDASKDETNTEEEGQPPANEA